MAALCLFGTQSMATTSPKRVRERKPPSSSLSCFLLLFQNVPFLELKSNEDGGGDGGEGEANDTAGVDPASPQFEGYIVDLLDEVTGQMDGVDYEIVLSEDGKYGGRDESSGKWSGMIGMIQDGVRSD